MDSARRGAALSMGVCQVVNAYLPKLHMVHFQNVGFIALLDFHDFSGE